MNAPHNPLRRIHSAITTARVNEAAARLMESYDAASVSVKFFLMLRGFTGTVFNKFQPMPSKVGTFGNERPLVGIPWMDTGRCVMVRQFSTLTVSDPSETDWRSTRTVTSGNSRYRSLFNVDAVRDQKHVIICGDEFDCMALWAFLSRHDYMDPPVAAYPHTHVSEEMLEDLQSAETITLWMDDTVNGKAQQDALIARLGTHRCRVAEVSQDILDYCMDSQEEQPTNAQDCLRLKVPRSDVLSILRTAKAAGEAPTVRPSHYRVSIEERIQGGITALGIPFPDQGLREHLIAARPGDVYWYTGQTKHGKTSSLTELAEDFARAGTPTACCFLEGSGPQIVTDNLHQRAFGKPLLSIRTQGEREAARMSLEQIDLLPLHLVPLRGMHRWSAIKDRLTAAVERMGCKVIVLDHFNQIEAESDYLGRDIRAHTDKTIHQIERLASDLKVPVILGGHPSKMDPEVIPTARSGLGGAAIMQVVAGSISVWRPEGIPGHWSQRKIKVTPDGWQEMTVTMNHNSVLYICTLKRANEAKTGHWFKTFDRQSLRTTYTGQSCPPVVKPDGKPLDDEPWTASTVPTHAEATHVED